MKELSDNDDPYHLKSISEVYEQEAVKRKKAGKRYRGYDLIKEVASFKARVQDLADRRAGETIKRSEAFLLSTCFLDMNEFNLEGKRFGESPTLNLASVDRLDALRYIVSIAETEI